MNETRSTAPLRSTSPHASAFSAAIAARAAYEDAVNSDGVTSAAWAIIADDLAHAAEGLVGTTATRGQVRCLADRAVDAAQRARYALRMLEVARSQSAVEMGAWIEAVRS